MCRHKQRHHKKATNKSIGLLAVNPEYPLKAIRITSKIICNIVILFIYSPFSNSMQCDIEQPQPLHLILFRL